MPMAGCLFRSIFYGVFPVVLLGIHCRNCIVGSDSLDFCRLLKHAIPSIVHDVTLDRGIFRSLQEGTSLGLQMVVVRGLASRVERISGANGISLP